MDEHNERWLPVADYEGCYEVSDKGRVRSVDRIVQCGNKMLRRRGKMLTPHVNVYGYPVVCVSANGRRAQFLVHQLVLKTFAGPRPSKAYVGCHSDGDKTNNCLSNLRWDTYSANLHDAVRHGTHGQASKTHCVRGHEYTPENTIDRGTTPGRFCRRCREDGNRTRLPRLRATEKLDRIKQLIVEVGSDSVLAQDISEILAS